MTATQTHNAAEPPVKYQSNPIILDANLAISKLDVLSFISFSETHPDFTKGSHFPVWYMKLKVPNDVINLKTTVD